MRAILFLRYVRVPACYYQSRPTLKNLHYVLKATGLPPVLGVVPSKAATNSVITMVINPNTFTH